MCMGSLTKGVLKAFVCLALLAIVVFGIASFGSDDSSAATSGNVKNSSDVTIGTYEFLGYTLTITGTDAPNTPSIILEDFDRQADVEVIVIRNYLNDLSASFPEGDYTSLDMITYAGIVKNHPDATWSYILSILSDPTREYEMTVTAGSETGLIDIVLDDFDMKSSVRSVIIYGYTNDLSGSFTSYTSLAGNITYKGSFGSYGGLWSYAMKTDRKSVV